MIRAPALSVEGSDDEDGTFKCTLEEEAAAAAAATTTTGTATSKPKKEQKGKEKKGGDQSSTQLGVKLELESFRECATPINELQVD